MLDASRDYRDWYERVYPRLSGQGLWLRGGELNTLDPVEAERRALRVLFVRLSTYVDTAASFTHQLLYEIAAAVPGVFPDLAYLPPPGDAPLFRADAVPWLLGTNTKRGPAAFDIVGFSLSVVQELLNLPAMLKESSIPLRQSERLDRPEVPLLLLGGASALYSSVCWGEDPWVDAVFIGESDVAIRRVLELCRDGKSAGRSKRETLALLQELPGILRPERPAPMRKASVEILDEGAALQRAPVLWLGERAGAAHLPISEGCPCFCSFCAESWDRKPYRERSLPRLMELALGLKAGMGLEAVDLSSSCFNAHSSIYSLLWELIPLFSRIGLKSERLDLLAHDPQLMPIQQALDKTSITCGVEGISPRLRRYLRKNLSPEDLRSGLSAILRGRARELKLFLIATGLEEEEDFAALGRLLDELSELRRQQGSVTRVIVSITPLVRFPFTPLERDDGFPIERYQQIIKRVAQGVRRAGLEFREAAELSESWVSQILVRASHPGVRRALTRTLEETGYLYYRSIDRAFQHRFSALLQQEGLDAAELLRGSCPDEEERGPWSVVDTGVKREHLDEQLARARAFEEDDYCLGRSWTRGKCRQCGACSPERVAVLTQASLERPRPPERYRERVRLARSAERPVRFLVEVGPRARGASRRVVGIALVRALFGVCRELVPAYRRYLSAQIGGEDEAVWLEGAEVLTLAWSESAHAMLSKVASDPGRLTAVNAELGGFGKWLGLAPQPWAPSQVEMRSPYRLAPDAHLRSLGLRFTLRRQAEGAYAAELAQASRRKGIISRLEWRCEPDGEVAVTLGPGPKLDLQEFMRRAFVLPHPSDWVRIRARVVGPG